MNKALHKWFLLGMLSFFLTGAWSQGAAVPGNWVFDVWDSDSGLPHSTVTSIAQTPDGYLWVGTQYGGLARFDGIRFEYFHPGKTAQMDSLEIQKLLVDPQGVLWVGTGLGSLVSYREGGMNSEFKLPDMQQGGLGKLISGSPTQTLFSTALGVVVQKLRQGASNHWSLMEMPFSDSRDLPCVDNEGVFWYRTSQEQLRVYKGGEVVAIEHPPGLKSPQIQSLIKDGRGRIWVGTDSEVAVWNGSRFDDMTPAGWRLESSVWQLAPSLDDALWVRTTTQISKLREGRLEFSVSPCGGEPFQHSSRNLAMFPDSRGGLWVVHYGAGVWHIDATGNVTHIGKESGLPSGLVMCWFEDREGCVWLGFHGGGLACLRPRLFHGVESADAARSRVVTTGCEEEDGTICFGLADGSLMRGLGENASFHVPPHFIYPSTDLRVLPAGKGRVYAGSVQNGVVLFENNGFTVPFPQYKLTAIEQEPLVATQSVQWNANALFIYKGARLMCTGREDKLWLCNDIGLFQWRTNQLKRVSVVEPALAASVLCMTEDAGGGLWLGLSSGELAHLDGDELSYFLPDDRQFLGGEELFSTLHPGAEGVLWIGSMGKGLLRFEKGVFTRFSMRDGLPDDHVTQLLEDGNGQVWIGTRRGIAQASIAELKAHAQGNHARVSWRCYGKAAGLPSLECLSGAQPSCWRGRDGRLWFTTARGAVWIKPSAVPEIPHTPAVIIEGLTLNGQPLSPASAAGVVVVPPGRHHLEFTFTAISMRYPQGLRFQWRLEGLEAEWIERGYSRVANYSFVPPGRYRFQVRACGSEGGWSQQAELSVIVRPFFWQTAWFLYSFAAVCLLLTVGGTAVAVRRIQQNRHRLVMEKVERQREVQQERERIARDIHDEIGSGLAHVAFMSDLAHETEDLPAAVQETLSKIYQEASGLARSVDEIVWAANPENDRPERCVSYMAQYADEFLRVAQVAVYVDMPAVEESENIEPSLRHHLFLALKEALANIVKHAQATRVRIRFGFEAEGLEIVVEDNGCGFDPTRCSQACDGHDGLANMKKRMALCGGSVTVTSSPGQGTTIRFCMGRTERHV